MVTTNIGVDIGGTHITAGLVDLEGMHLDESSVVRRSVNAQGDADMIIREWATCIAEVPGFHSFSSKMSIAMPGPFDYEMGVSLIKDQEKYKALYALDVKTLLAHQLGVGVENIRFLNDAASFLNGEVLAGTVRGVGRAVGITLGTGLGSSYYEHGQAVDAALWNTPFKDGIAEDYLSTRWFLRQYEQRSGRKLKGVKEMVAPGNYDSHARSLFVEFADNLSVFLKVLIKMKQPQAVVIGGNIVKAHSFYLPLVHSNLQAVGMDVPIYFSQLGEHAALIGAAGTWTCHSQH